MCSIDYKSVCRSVDVCVCSIDYKSVGGCVCSIEANQMEDRAMNKMWLVRHLEVTRQLVLEDLRVVKV